MIYKVKYYKLAIMKDGRIGNISQGQATGYMNTDIEYIQDTLNYHLELRKQAAVVTSIKSVSGTILCNIPSIKCGKEVNP